MTATTAVNTTTAVTDPVPAAFWGAPTGTYVERTTRVWPRPGQVDLFDAVVAERWQSLRGVHGGHLAALAVRAVEASAPDRVVRTLSTTYLRPAAVGPIELEVRAERRGRTVTTATVELRQVGRTVALVRATAVAPVVSEDWDTSTPLDLPPVSECIPLQPPPGILHFEHAEALLDPADIPFSGSTVARVGGWVRPREAQVVDGAWLAMILDWFPPSPFTRREQPVGGVSVDFTVHLHTGPFELEGGDWLGARFESERGTDGLALERGRIHSPSGSVLAESFHTRWTGR